MAISPVSFNPALQTQQASQLAAPQTGTLSSYTSPATAKAPFQSPGIGPENNYQPQRLGEILQSQGLANATDINAALNQSQANGEMIGQTLVRNNRINSQQLNQALAFQNDQRILQQALGYVGQIINPPQDEAYMRHMGVKPPFQHGQQALDVIRNKQARVEYGDMGDSPAHAQWIPEQNLIMINQRYRGDNSSATVHAIAAAIYHEAGHASGNGDGESSIQEETNCLALNTLAHRYFENTVPGYKEAVSGSRLLSDGVALYPKLFFDQDPQKKALVNRIVQKYGDLPMWSPGHEVPPAADTPQSPLPIAYRVAKQVDDNNVAKGLLPPSPSLGQVPPGLPKIPETPQLPSPPGLPTTPQPPAQPTPPAGQQLALNA